MVLIHDLNQIAYDSYEHQRHSLIERYLYYDPSLFQTNINQIWSGEFSFRTDPSAVALFRRIDPQNDEH